MVVTSGAGELGPENLMRCCFCGLVPSLDEYVELRLRVAGSPARQFFGAHRDHLTDRLAPGFRLELEPLDNE
jgi:hypothetical protein